MNQKKIAGWVFLISGIMMLVGIVGQMQDFIPRLLKVTENIEYYMRNRIFLIECLFLLGFGVNGILAIAISRGLTRGEKRVWGLAFIPTCYMLLMAVLILVFTPQDWMHSLIYTLPFGLAMFISLILCRGETR